MEAREMFSTRADMVAFIADRDGPNCYLCEQPFTESRRVTIDHYHPQSKGGTWDIENLKLAHKKCNTEKGDRVFIDGVLEPKVRRIGYRERKAGKQEALAAFCELCYDGRLLFDDEDCPECGREPAKWGWNYKMHPNECPHSGKFWCWMDASGIITREPAIVDVLNGDVEF
jgi:hypothetical protein